MYVATYSTGSCRTATDRQGTRYHAVTIEAEHLSPFNSWHKSICGYKPGKRSNGWSDYRHHEVTCHKCLKRLNDMNHERIVLEEDR